MTKVKYSPATWLKRNLVIALLNRALYFDFNKCLSP